MESQLNSIIMSKISNLLNNLPKNGMPNTNEFTCLSSFVLSNQNNIDEVIICSLCTGTKCIGNSTQKNQGCLLSDSHAEVLAKRAFDRYLLLNILDTSDNSVLEYNITSSKYKLKDKWKCHLYISDNPCGDCSIYERSNGLMNFTGAKPINLDSNAEISCCNREDIQLTGALRTKSGRSTIMEKYRTTSMSCSDKVCRWIVLGVLGSLISNIIEPIYIDCIIIGADKLSRKEEQLTALERSLHHRLRSFGDKIRLPKLSIVDNDIKFGKCFKEWEYQQQMLVMNKVEYASCDARNKEPTKPSPCGTSINWIKDVTLNDSVNINRDNHDLHTELIDYLKSQHRCKPCSQGSVEVTLAQNGCLQGAIKSSVGGFKTTSRLSRRNIGLLFHQLWNGLHTDCRPKCDEVPKTQIQVCDDDGISGKHDEEVTSHKITYNYWKYRNIEYRQNLEDFLSIDCFRFWIRDQQDDFVIDEIQSCNNDNNESKRQRRR